MPFTVAEFQDLVRLVEERPEWRAELRRLVLTEELLALPEQVTRLRQDTEQGFQRLTAAQARTDQQLELLSQAQARTEAQMKVLSQAQARTEARLTDLAEAQARTEARLTDLAEAQARMEVDLRWLMNWQRGESGRRDGERYERDTLRRAPALFAGGQGGPPDRPDVQQRLVTLLASVLTHADLEAENDPFLADLVWWKGEQTAVVEVSLQVDRQDVHRAERRAATLRQSGAQVVALVIGEQWATPEAREQAQLRRIDWKIAADLSAGFLAFRRS